MSASALHARAQDMVDPANRRRLLHKYEVPMRKETVLCLDAQVRPLGNASCGPGPMQKYELRSQPTVSALSCCLWREVIQKRNL